MAGYLEELTVKLTSNLGELSEATLQRHAAYFLAQQRDDGGFAGREGESDLYYTGFGLRGLTILGELYGPVGEKSASFLSDKLTGRESVIDLLSLIYGTAMVETAAGIDCFRHLEHDWKTDLATWLETLRREDGGYAKGPQGTASSTYHTFLVLLCLQLLERSPPQPEKIVEFLYARQQEEGGFLEIRVGKRAGANPTAAAIASLRMLDALDDETRERTLDFMCDMQTDDEGGFRANTRIPFADLLSTFTALVTLADLDALEEAELEHAQRYVKSLESPQGGFRAASIDEVVDVEYSFYGIGALAFLGE